MTKPIKKSTGRRRSAKKANLLDTITGGDALSILQVLAQRDANLARTIEAIAMELLSDVDIDEIAADVQMGLESLAVEDVWERSGANAHGYLEPGDAAWEMFEEVLQPFQDVGAKYAQLLMQEESRLYCQGILKGLYDFHKASSSEFKDWAVDAPGEFFGLILDDWNKLSSGKASSIDILEFLEAQCPDWAGWAVKSLRSGRRGR